MVLLPPSYFSESLRRIGSVTAVGELRHAEIGNRDTKWRFSLGGKDDAGAVLRKLRTDRDFLAAIHLGEILEHAVRIGSEKAGHGMPGTKRIDHFALPVAIDGGESIAWFTARVPAARAKGPDGALVLEIHEFGLYESDKVAKLRAPWNASSGKSAGAGTVGEFLDSFGGRVPWASRVSHDVAHEENVKLTAKVLLPIVRQSQKRNLLLKGKGPDRPGVVRPQIFASELTLTPEERSLPDAPYEIGVAYGPRGHLYMALTANRPDMGPAMTMPKGQGRYTVTHQHPGGMPPSLFDLKWLLLGNPEHVLRIVARQKDGSIDLYQMSLEGEISEGEVAALIEKFQLEVKGRRDSLETRLDAIKLTIERSEGKLKLSVRKFQ